MCRILWQVTSQQLNSTTWYTSTHTHTGILGAGRPLRLAHFFPRVKSLRSICPSTGYKIQSSDLYTRTRHQLFGSVGSHKRFKVFIRQFTLKFHFPISSPHFDDVNVRFWPYIALSPREEKKIWLNQFKVSFRWWTAELQRTPRFYGSHYSIEMKLTN